MQKKRKVGSKNKDSESHLLEINDLIFKELLARGYSLEGKNKVWNISDSKLWYITSEQAKAFLDLEHKDPKQKMFAKKEIELMKKSVYDITHEVANKPFTVIDLGCGNGEKGLSFIKLFKNKSNVRYCPIDINEFMISETMKNFSKVKGVSILKFKNNVLDFLDLEQLAGFVEKGKFKNSYFLLLGGNLENSDAHELLHEVRSGMHEGDKLLIGNKLTHPDPTKMVAYYNKSKQINNLLIKTLEQLGFKRNEVSYEARFRGNRIEMLYHLLVDRTVIFNKKRVDFKKGDKIIVAISYKYTADSLKELLMMYFDNVQVFPSKDKTYALALCKK